MSDNRPLPIGTEVEPYGEVAAVGTFGSGERYYHLTDPDADATVVAMMPADVIEPLAMQDEAGEGDRDGNVR